MVPPMFRLDFATRAMFAGDNFASRGCFNSVMTIEDLKSIVHSDPKIMVGTSMFVGTYVPLQNLVDALKSGESIEDFLKGFPSVTRS